jgi:hypothetical protein
MERSFFFATKWKRFLDGSGCGQWELERQGGCCLLEPDQELRLLVSKVTVHSFPEG